MRGTLIPFPAGQVIDRTPRRGAFARLRTVVRRIGWAILIAGSLMLMSALVGCGGGVVFAARGSGFWGDRDPSVEAEAMRHSRAVLDYAPPTATHRRGVSP